MKNFALVLLLFIGWSGCGKTIVKDENVVLVHGMGRTRASMVIMKNRLEKAGYRVISKNYPSTKAPITEHVAWLQRTVKECCNDTNVKTHFVTHSLGGIVVRAYLKKHPLPNLGRVVMLSPPNKGSEITDHLKDWEVYKKGTGPSGQELGTHPKSAPRTLGPVEFELGIIAGDRSLNPFYSQIIPGVDDGKVSVESAQVQGMQDFLVVHHTHSYIMNAPEVAQEVRAFLETGKFK